MHCPTALIDGLVGVSSRSGVGIGDGNPPVAPARNIAGAFAFRPIWVPQRVVLVGITVRPAVDGNRFDVSCGIESACTEHTLQLVTDVPLKCFKGSGQQFVMSRTLLLAGGQPRLAGSAQHSHQYRLFRGVWTFVIADTHGLIE